MKLKFSFIFLILLFSWNSFYAQQDSIQILKKEKKVKKTILPIAFYLPETGFAFGAIGTLSFRFKKEPKKSRPSQIIFSTAYTLKKQLLIFLPYQLYFDNENNRLEGELGYYRYFYSFYGIGPHTQKNDKETYGVNFPRIQNRYLRRIKGDHFLGTGFKYDFFDIVNFEENGLLSSNEYIGKEGKSTWMTSFNYLFDNRNHLFFPTKGFYADFNIDLSKKGILSNYTFAKFTLDLRSFNALNKKLILANQFYFSSTSEGIPFYYLPYISSQVLARGFADRRFMDRTLSNLQTELRFPIFKRFKGATFISLTNVGEKINQQSLKLSGGIGFRYELNKIEKTRLRLDIGFTKESFNFYITFNEAF